MSGVANKIVVVNSAFHHLIDIAAFLDALKSAMIAGDLFFLCHEPNNRYAATGFMWLGLLLRALTSDAALRRLGLTGRRATAEDRARWRAINDDLLKDGVIRSPLCPIVIRRIIDYGVNKMGDWPRVGVPSDHDEGYWTVADVEAFLGDDFTLVYHRTYRHFGDPRGNRVLGALNRLCERLFREGGADFSAVFERRV